MFLIKRFNLKLLYILVLFYISCTKIDIQRHIIGNWRSIGNGKIIEMVFYNENEFEIKMMEDVDSISFKGTYAIDNVKIPNTIDFKNISNYSKPLYSIIKNIDPNTIHISKFSNQWRLRPISFEENNTLLFHRITTKGN